MKGSGEEGIFRNRLSLPEDCLDSVEVEEFQKIDRCFDQDHISLGFFVVFEAGLDVFGVSRKGIAFPRQGFLFLGRSKVCRSDFEETGVWKRKHRKSKQGLHRHGAKQENGRTFFIADGVGERTQASRTVTSARICQ